MVMSLYQAPLFFHNCWKKKKEKELINQDSFALSHHPLACVNLKGNKVTNRCGVLQVCFRLVMFRPFVGEVIVAKVKESDADGLRCMIH